jgi:hypothetical protein
MKFNLALLVVPAAAALSGCVTPIPVIPEPISCPIADDLVAQSCASPSALADSASYGELIKAGLEDRNALSSCARHDKLLADSIRECNAAIGRYKTSIKEINDRNAK